MLYKDHCNRKSNQQNLGTIHSSNLCRQDVVHGDHHWSAGTEIIEFTSPDEVAVCTFPVCTYV